MPSIVAGAHSQNTMMMSSIAEKDNILPVSFGTSSNNYYVCTDAILIMFEMRVGIVVPSPSCSFDSLLYILFHHTTLQIIII